MALVMNFGSVNLIRSSRATSLCCVCMYVYLVYLYCCQKLSCWLICQSALVV